MEESEKMMALKKAYAEIIFNTTKEAAVRIMESERKTVKFQQELFSVKEESLRMLARLKQILNSKSNDAEIVCVNQQRKIDELEAQLNEAEDIVKELREELSEVQTELARAKTMPSQAERREELVAVSNAKILSSGRTNQGSNERVKSDSCTGYCCSPNRDFASIMRRSKDSKLHRNGCTQRIRACESNSCKEVQKEACESGNEEGDRSCGSTEPSSGNGSEMFGLENSIAQFEAPRSIRRKRKQATRYSNGKTSSFLNLLNHTEETHNPSCSKDDDKMFMKLEIASIEQSGKKDNGSIESRSNQVFGNPLDKGLTERTASPMNLPSDDEDVQNPFCSKDSPEEDKAFIQSEVADVWQRSDRDKGSVDSQIERASNEPETASDPAPCAADCEKLEDSMPSLDLRALGYDDGVPGQSPDRKFIKYTFQRKKKREVSCSPDPNSCAEKDSLRSVQVAHQPILSSET